MNTYISILRGINVSGKKVIKMDALRRMYEGLGYKNTVTYIQSGNVIFQDSEFNHKSLEEKISNQIKIDYGFDVSVIVLSVVQFKKIINDNPFTKNPVKNTHHIHITFLSGKPLHIEPETIENKKSPGEEIYFTDHAVYLYCPGGYGKTKLTTNFLEQTLKVTGTTRNWNSTLQILKIALDIS
jgi:uncharacterized protein (DUF1697 family)